MTKIQMSELPAIGAALGGGIFAGLSTKKDGTHCAVVLLPGNGSGLDWPAAKKWAEEAGGELPSRPVAAMLFANVRDDLRQLWHWTAEEREHDAYYAWLCYFDYGDQNYHHKSYAGAAVAVRLIQIDPQ
jgi:hypothetical protein